MFIKHFLLHRTLKLKSLVRRDNNVRQSTTEDDLLDDPESMTENEEIRVERVKTQKRQQLQAEEIKKLKEVISSHESQTSHLQEILASNHKLEEKLKQNGKRLDETKLKLCEVSESRKEQFADHQEQMRQASETQRKTEHGISAQIHKDDCIIQELQANLVSLQHYVDEQKHASSAQVSELKRQVEGLKKTVAASSRERDVVSDDTLRDKVNTWGLDAQNWALSCCKGAKLGKSVSPSFAKVF